MLIKSQGSGFEGPLFFPSLLGCKLKDTLMNYSTATTVL